MMLVSLWTPWALVVMIGVISGFHHESMIPRSHYLYRGSMTDSMRAEAPLERQEGGRRQFLGQGGVLTSSLAIGVIGSISSSEAANALVKGSSPPPPRSKQVTSGKRTCKSIDECEEIGRLKEEELFSTAETEEAQTTTKGDKYRDLKIGNGAIEVCTGSEVAVKYRVLRLGKRSRDGLSGEASPVFSLGYGEDDDSEQDTTRFTVGAFNIVPAINDGILGMKAGTLNVPWSGGRVDSSLGCWGQQRCH